MNTINIVCTYNTDPISIFIERVADGLIYDNSNNTFSSSPQSPLISLKHGQGIKIGRLETSVNITSTFIDGDYAINFVNVPTGNIFSISQISIFGGSTTTFGIDPNALGAGIATRILNSDYTKHTTPSTYGILLSMMMQRIQDIASKLGI